MGGDKDAMDRHADQVDELLTDPRVQEALRRLDTSHGSDLQLELKAQQEQESAKVRVDLVLNDLGAMNEQ